MEAGRLADLHAYVDDCLEPDERLAFEQQMAQDPALARRAALWRAQNSAIRTAFDGEGARAFPISIVRHQNESFGRAARSGAAGAKPSGEQPARASLAAVAQTGATFSEDLGARRVSAVACMAAGARGFVRLPCLRLGSGRDRRPRQRLGEAGVAAFQAFARPGVEPVEFATSDRSRSASVVDDAAHAPRLSPGDSLRPQAHRSADRALSRRPGGLSDLQVARQSGRVAGPIARRAADDRAATPRRGRRRRGGMDMARPGTCPGRRPRRSGIAEDCGRLRRPAGGSRSAHARARLVRLLIAHLLHERGQFRIRLVRQNDP